MWQRMTRLAPTLLPGVLERFRAHSIFRWSVLSLPNPIEPFRLICHNCIWTKLIGPCVHFLIVISPHCDNWISGVLVREGPVTLSAQGLGSLCYDWYILFQGSERAAAECRKLGTRDWESEGESLNSISLWKSPYIISIFSSSCQTRRGEQAAAVICAMFALIYSGRQGAFGRLPVVPATWASQGSLAVGFHSELNDSLEGSQGIQVFTTQRHRRCAAHFANELVDHGDLPGLRGREEEILSGIKHVAELLS